MSASEFTTLPLPLGPSLISPVNRGPITETYAVLEIIVVVEFKLEGEREFERRREN